MFSKPIICAALLALTAAAADVPTFMGRKVTLVEAPMADEFFPKGPASVCLEAPPQRQCYTAPAEYGRVPEVELVRLDKNTPALLFSAKSGGVSGWSIHFALLRPGTGGELEDLLWGGVSLSNQSEHAMWTLPSISEAPVFVTADFVWGPGESHYSAHRYTISAYVWRYSDLAESYAYYLDDRYMTVRQYDSETADILAAEKPEILARLRRVHPQR